jgi:hypothetical protein
VHKGKDSVNEEDANEGSQEQKTPNDQKHCRVSSSSTIESDQITRMGYSRNVRCCEESGHNPGPCSNKVLQPVGRVH